MNSTHASRNGGGDRRFANLGGRRRVTTGCVGDPLIEDSSRVVSAEPTAGYARYVGRVAGLAVALGVGAAIASMPAVAFADTTGSGGSEGSSSAGSASSSSGSDASSGGSTAGTTASDDSDDSDSTHETTSSSSFGSGSEDASEGSGSEDASDIPADVAADIDDADIGEDNSPDPAPDTRASDSSSSDAAVRSISGTAATDSEAGPDEAGPDVDAVEASLPVEAPAVEDGPLSVTTTSSDAGSADAATSTLDSGDGVTAADVGREAGKSDAAAHAVASTAVGSAANAAADAFWLFGDGTAEHPNGGVLSGNGFSWNANSCTGTSACTGGNAGIWGGNGGNGFNGGNGGAAGWSGNGGNGGAGIPGGNGGNGGRGGLIFGSGGNGGVGGAAVVAAGAPGLGGTGGQGGWFGSDGRVGNAGAAFPNPSAPTIHTVAFDFIYGTGSQYWSSTARDALEAAALALSSYIAVDSPVTLTYDVSGEYSPFNSTLAWASSSLSGSPNGFFDTVVQQKVLSGVDANGQTADGRINFNFGPSWGLGSSVGSGQYDFQSTAIHELAHTFGLISFVDSAGSNTLRDWTLFDSFIVDSNNVNVIGNDFRWNTAYNPNLTGANGGLYFGGPNAVAAYGGLVPLYTPNPWKSGSSVSHLNNSSFNGANTPLLSPVVKLGLGVRALSPIELGMLQDLGYTLASPQQTYALLFITFMFGRRRKTNRSSN
jgi:hypothetical protein